MRDELDENKYPQGVKVSETENGVINLSRHAFHGDRNYTISPRHKILAKRRIDYFSYGHALISPARAPFGSSAFRAAKRQCAPRGNGPAPTRSGVCDPFSKLLIYKEINSWSLTGAIEQTAEKRFSRGGTDYRSGAGTDE
jgi:hypothetical protein